jgi:PhzF family phenazine biosynthesis protein
MVTLPFQQVDVFTSVPFKGNPVAVVLEGDGLSTDQMKAIARWTNLSETTFLCTPTDPAADYWLRIFTPANELPFAGHPTVGSAHAALRHGVKPKTKGRLVQQCGKGLVPISIDGERLFFALPAAKFNEPERAQLTGLAEALGTATSSLQSATLVDVGPIWFTAQLPSAAAVMALRPSMEKLGALADIGITGVTVFGMSASNGADIEVRSFAPSQGVPEDPVCGSGNGSVAALIQRERLIADSEYVASQGRCIGRDGRVEVRFADDGTIWVGGHAVTCVEGSLRL